MLSPLASPPGFRLSSHLLQLIVLRFADEELQLCFDDFLTCLVRLENASRECPWGCGGVHVLSPGENPPPPATFQECVRNNLPKLWQRQAIERRRQSSVMSVGS